MFSSPQDMFGGHPGMAQYRMQGTPPMAPRVGGPSMGGGGGGRGGLPHPAAAGARHRPPNLLGFPDMHMMMGMFPHGMLSAGGAVPTINREYREHMDRCPPRVQPWSLYFICTCLC